MLLFIVLIPQHYYKINILSAWSTKSCPVFAVSELSPVFMLRKENKQNSDMTWQKYK